MRNPPTNWCFDAPPNVAVYTSRSILDGEECICYVSHDEGDGAWQFHPPGGPTRTEEARVVSLSTMVGIDATITELADLPLGWHAWRDTKNSEWHRMKR